MPNTFPLRATITGLFVYPLKSARGVALTEAVAGPCGFPGDRDWMIVDSTGNFVTQRQKAELATLVVTAAPGGLILSCGGLVHHAQVSAAISGERVKVTVWGEHVVAYDCGDAAAAFLAAAVGRHRGRTLRLAYRRQLRPVAPGFADGLGAQVSFADGFPYLVAAEESLEDLNQRVLRAHAAEAPLTMARFRPNVVLRGLPPFAEDSVASLTTKAGVELRLVKPCARCVITMLDPETGAKGPEPLRTLREFRREAAGILFGQNAVLAAGTGEALRVGDEVAVTYRHV